MMSARAGTFAPEHLTLLGHRSDLLERDAAPDRSGVARSVATLSAPASEFSRHLLSRAGA